MSIVRFTIPRRPLVFVQAPRLQLCASRFADTGAHSLSGGRSVYVTPDMPLAATLARSAWGSIVPRNDRPVVLADLCIQTGACPCPMGWVSAGEESSPVSRCGAGRRRLPAPYPHPAEHLSTMRTLRPFRRSNASGLI